MKTLLKAALLFLWIFALAGCNSGSGNSGGAANEETTNEETEKTYTATFYKRVEVFSTITEDSGTVINLPNGGGNFDGWHLQSDFSDGARASNSEYALVSDVKFYGKWSYTASFYDGDIELFSVTLANAADITLYNTKERDFEGWHLDNETGDRYDADDTFTLENRVKFYGKWSSLKVATAQDIRDIGNGLEKSYRLRDNISLAAYVNWVPIGSDTVPFKGRIYGNGHKISDLSITNVSGSYAGLFGYIEDAFVYDLSVVSADIDVSKSNTADLYAGIIAGYARNSNVDNCFVSGEVSASQTNSKNAYAGGAAGYFSGGIKRCASSANVSASSGVGAYAGGMVGQSGNSGVNIIESYAKGNIDSTHYAGGIVGMQMGGSISGSFHKNGTIKAESASNTVYAGGIAAYMSGVYLVNSYAAGSVNANVSGASSVHKVYAGGITGYLNNYGAIDKSYSTAEVYASNTASGVIYAGGIAGFVENDNTVSNSAVSSYMHITGNGALCGRVAGGNNSTLLSNNIANEDMVVDYSAYSVSPNPGGKDGGDILANYLVLPSTFIDSLYWDFGNTEAAPWRIIGSSYPSLYWEDLTN